MNVKELYDYITKHMTSEQALMKLLEGSIIEYEKLKFDDKQKAVHPLIIISMAAADLGWDMVIENEEVSGDVIRGIVVGTEDYLKTIFPSKEDV